MSEKKFDVKTEIKVDLSQEDIDDIMVGALEGGICHWCSCAEVVGKYLGEYASEQISRGGKLILHDAESDDKWELTLEKFLRGISLWLSNGGVGCVEGKKLDVCMVDADCTDAIVQYALFGEVIYG